MPKIKKENVLRAAALGGALGLYLFMACYKLTNASLWFDETVEYDVSTASLHGLDMYNGIIDTYQPPLYNLLMHFWLSVSDTEWWFRFAGVVFGLMGAVGLFLALRRATGRFGAGVAAVVMFSFSIKLLYYVQECAEYALLLGILPWLLYFHVRLFQKADWPGVLGWVACCVLAMYTQYGAAFPVAASGLCLLAHFAASRQFAALRRWLAAGAVGGLAAGVPLIFFFYLPQARHEATLSDGVRETMGTAPEFFVQLPQKLFQNVAWLFFHDAEGLLGLVLAVGLLALGAGAVWALARRRSSMAASLTALALACFALFYVAAFGGWYGHPYWGEVDPFRYRYGLFMGPLWLAAFLALAAEGLAALAARLQQKKPGPGVQRALCVAAVLAVCLFCARNVQYELAENWTKDDNRGMVAAWYEMYAYEHTTFVITGTVSPFRYYLRHNEDFRAEYEQNVIYQTETLDTVEEYTEYILAQSPDGLPETVLLPVSAKNEAFDAQLAAFEQLGYTLESVYNHDGAALWKGHRPPD